MSKSLGRELITALLPEGDFWTPKDGGDLDLIYEAQGQMIDLSIDAIKDNANIRNPLTTPILNDLEREFGIIENTTLTEDQRRVILNAKKYEKQGGGTASILQKALAAAGFDVLVHKNNPAVDPALFLTQNYQMVAGGDNAYAGDPDAYAGILGGYLLANGSVYEQTPAYTAQAGGDDTVAGDSSAVAGAFTGLNKDLVEYVVPTDSVNWPFVFFVGGAATRDVDGKLTKIEQGFIASTRQQEFEKIILSIKPLFTWAAIIVTYN